MIMWGEGGGGREMTKIGLFPKIELSPSKGRILATERSIFFRTVLDWQDVLYMPFSFFKLDLFTAK